MSQLIAIALGGSAGALLRFFISGGIYGWLGRSFPHGTLFVNVSGSFLMGFLSELILQKFAASAEYRAAILIGFLGAYTTFSTFAIETLYLFESGELLKAGLNIFLSTVLCVVAVWIGLVIGRQLFAADVYPWFGYGFPYASLIGALALTFVLAGAAEFTGNALHLSAVYRGMALIALLGVAVVGFSLWTAIRLGELQTGFQGLLGIYVVNTLGGGMIVWLGALAGEWVWRAVEPG